MQKKENVQRVRSLHREGGNINFANRKERDRTTFQTACFFGDYEIVEFLLTLDDLDLNYADKDLETALHLAVSKNHADATRLLASHPSLDTILANEENKTALGV